MLCKCMSPAAGGGQGHAQVTHSRTAGLSPRTQSTVLEYGVVLVLMVAVHLSFGFPKKERLTRLTNRQRAWFGQRIRRGGAIGMD